MEKDIRFTGYTATPSDYESSDGELTQCHNLISEDGAIHSLLAPKVIANLGKDEEVVYIHKTASYTHYITIYKPDGVHTYGHYTLSSINEPATKPNEKTQIYTTNHNFSHINAIGNTLLLFTSTEIVYFVWKKGEYHCLGTGLPELDISFGLQGECKLWSETSESEGASKRGTFTVDTGGVTVNIDYHRDFRTKEAQTKVTEIVMAKVNKFIAEQSTGKGRFCFPFMVRYALKLYDGSYIHHSAPILMMPGTDNPIQVIASYIPYGGIYDNDSVSTFKADIFLMACQLDYMFSNPTQVQNIAEWKDIITSVDIFVSKPIYTYKQDGLIKQLLYPTHVYNCFYGKITNIKENALLSGDNIYSNFFTKDCLRLGTDQYNDYDYVRIELPPVDEDTYLSSQANNTSLFYLLHSIKVSDITTGSTQRMVVPVKDDYLGSLTSRPTLPDDYRSHDTIVARKSFVYNGRLSVTDVSTRLFAGFCASSLLPYVNGQNSYDSATKMFTFTPYSGAKAKMCAVIEDTYGNSHSFVREDNLESFGPVTLFEQLWGYPYQTPFLFYPSASAKALYLSQGDIYLQKWDMVSHAFLEGSRTNYANGLGIAGGNEWIGLPPINPDEMKDQGGRVEQNGKIYTSDVNNPFRFDVTNINTIGTGTILGLSSAAKALSQGQFGQFPLYAFTSEGIWALEVSSTTGAFSARQPITRDVCISADSITQIDSSVLFATERGIMEISGSTTSCITDIINGPEFFDLAKLPGLASLYPQGLPKIDCTFAEYRKNARMAYDYTNQRIFLFNPTKNYAYVFSMKSKLWGIMASTLLSALNSYPDALAMARTDSGNTLVDLSHSDLTSVPGLIVTRPIKLDAGSMLKTFDAVFLRGLFGKRKVQTILYGSRDNISWHLVHSSKEHFLTGLRGTPYKYFRICAITNLSVGETLVGASVSYTPRLTNKMR